MKKYSKPISVFAKIFEIFFWVGCALSLLHLIITFFPGLMKYGDFITSLFLNQGKLDILGVTIDGWNGNMVIGRLILAFMAAVLGCYAMVARNIHLISKHLVPGKHSEEETPFTPDIVRMVREIGFFLIGTVALGFIFTWIMQAISFAQNLPIQYSVSLNGLLFGLIVLYLSTIFQYGCELQNDVDGLV